MEQVIAKLQSQVTEAKNMLENSALGRIPLDYLEGRLDQAEFALEAATTAFRSTTFHEV